MFHLAAAGLYLMLGAPAVLWFDARELDTAVAVPQPGEYTVWLWTAPKTAAEITLNGEAIRVSVQGDPDKDPAVWTRAAREQLPGGPVTVQCPREVWAVVLAPDEDYDPAQALPDRRVLDGPDRVHDGRAERARHTDTVFTMPHFAARDDWESAAAPLRRRVLLSSGLLPMPERTPLNAQISGRIEHPDYAVEKVAFEARPGFYVTGNLYRPAGDGPFPAIVSPHGHWKNGRLENSDTGSVPGRCITLARMGIVVFSYDMIGYNDSCQFPHNWGGDREKLWAVHPFAMQLWSSIRAVDFVAELPGVDPGRIGCTGASGGGTQTFALCSVDPRIQAAAPVNMISSTMQGGCLCENAPLLRLANSNMEIGALMAPKPLLMVSATGDWTRETPRVEFPAIRSVYALYSAGDQVSNVHIDAGHNYNQASREAMYRFFGRHFLPGRDWSAFTEPPFEVEPDAHLRVFPGSTPPDGAPNALEVTEAVIAANAAKWRAVLPRSEGDIAAFRETYGDVLPLVFGAAVPGVNDLEPERTGRIEREDHILERWIIRRPAAGDAIPALFYHARDAAPQDAVLIAHGDGKAALADAGHGAPGPLVAGLLAQGKAVLAIDLFLTGEHHAPGAATTRLRIGRFMDTFQPTDAGYRVQDVLTAAAFLRARRDLTGRVSVVGLAGGGLPCLFAAAIDPGIDRAVVDLDGFDASDDEAWVRQFYVPCLRAAGDVLTAAALIAPRPLYTLHAGAAFAGAAPAFAPRSLESEAIPGTLQ